MRPGAEAVAGSATSDICRTGGETAGSRRPAIDGPARLPRRQAAPGPEDTPLAAPAGPGGYGWPLADRGAQGTK